MKKLKNILVVEKTSKLKYLFSRYGDITTKESVEFKMLGESMDQHKINCDKFIDMLTKTKPKDVKVDVVEDNFLDNKSISTMIEKDYDLIFSLGGDGTFLRTAQFIDDNETILIGVNTDPLNSRGFYCSMDTGFSVPSNLEKIFKQRIKLINLNKIQVQSKMSKYYFLNDLYFGERFMGRISKYRLQVDDGREETLKSSGIIFSTCKFFSLNRFRILWMD
jgi:NAD kinase